MSSFQYVPIGEQGFRTTVVSTSDESQRFIELAVVDSMADSEPLLDGDESLIKNPALIGHLLNAGVNEFALRRESEAELLNALRKAVTLHSRAAVALADYTKSDWHQTRRGWCSCCFALTEHRVVDGAFAPAVCICTGCGDATTPCVAPACRNLARRPHGTVRIPSYCAEHRHEVRSFSGSTRTYEDIDAIDDLRKFDKKPLAAYTRTVVIAGVGAAVVAPLAFLAAPAIGGALGASGLIGPALSGAAASSHGLATLGGGAIAAGGLGMAGGTAVVAASGAALGGTLGAVTATAYLQDDKSFRIEKLKDGSGVPVLVATGFLTEGGSGWGPWERIVSERYPDNPVYRVHWGAKELAAITLVAGGASIKFIAGGVIRYIATHAARKSAQYIPGIGAVAVVADLLGNPWHVAKNRADQTAAVLADLLARVKTDKFVLVGHSLGARVMLGTAQLLATKGGETKLEDVHLLGAAMGVGGNWRLLDRSVSGKVWNYFSTKDPVLKYLYTTAQGGQRAVGNVGFETKHPNIIDVSVSDEVALHSEYFQKVSLRPVPPDRSEW